MSTINSRITPVSNDYATCAECYVKLSIYPGGMHPDEVSEILILEPTQQNNLGETITNSLGRTRVIKQAAWYLSSELYVQSKDIREHLNWILEKINPSEIGLKQLQCNENVKMSLCCVWCSKYGHGGPVLWPEQMKNISNLNLECSFDIYFTPDE